MTDQSDQQDLEDRVEQLESTISKMLPGRRDALKLGGAALVGGAAMSGSASAGTQQAGTIGTANDPVDVESEDINNADTVTTQDLVVNGTVTGIANADGPNKSHVETVQNVENLPVTINFSQGVELVEMYHSARSGGVDMQLNGETGTVYEHIELGSGNRVTSDSFPVIGDAANNRHHGTKTEITSFDVDVSRATYETRGGRSTNVPQFFIGVMGSGQAEGPINQIKLLSSDGSNQEYEYTAIGYSITGGGK